MKQLLILLLLFSTTTAMHDGGHMHREKITKDQPHKGQAHTDDHFMHGMYGHFYRMNRESSGTSWVPESTPFLGFSTMKHGWMMMFEGFAYTVFDKQGGKRGDKKLFNTNMFMFMMQKEVTDQDTFAIRTMFSLEPLTVGKCGYPLLFQTGETCDGKTPLVDRQHPHDLFMELALVLSHQIREKTSIFFYLGVPGEPALGPPTFMHRYSALFNPEAPLGHHWMDSTHITFGVATMGCIYDTFKIEASAFTGREPDQERFNFDKSRFDSFSLRLAWNPTEDLAFQTSYAFLNAPEQLEPDVNTKRYTISALYNKQFDTGNWQTAAIIGINNNKPGIVSPAFLLESTCTLKKHTVFFVLKY
jgi:hypothetical protein